MKRLIFAGLCFVLAACSDGPTASRILSEAGYKDITTTGYSMFSCGEHDTYATGFEATGPTGQHVTGVVCSGIFKAGTIRIF
jgi:2-methylisocitrate lyase-like PEP mutase family enzyme